MPAIDVDTFEAAALAASLRAEPEVDPHEGAPGCLCDTCRPPREACGFRDTIAAELALREPRGAVDHDQAADWEEEPFRLDGDP